MVDEGKFIAQRAVEWGVPVVWEQCEAMPHCFTLLPPLNQLPQAQKVFVKWADFCRATVERPEGVKRKGTRTGAEGLRESEIDMGGLLDLSFEVVKQRMDKARMEAAGLLARRERLRTKL